MILVDTSLVDTSVWIDHLRTNEERLVHLLDQTQVVMHPMIWGELACGNLKNRSILIKLWQNLPHISEATHNETMFCLEQRKLMSRGVGYMGCAWQESH